MQRLYGLYEQLSASGHPYAAGQVGISLSEDRPHALHPLWGV